LAPLPEGLHARLAALAAECGVPLRAVLLAAHLRVMALLGGGDKVATGVVRTTGGPRRPTATRSSAPSSTPCR
ncbi:hypothetical protein, partial [Streptomyces avidinii]